MDGRTKTKQFVYSQYSLRSFHFCDVLATHPITVPATWGYPTGRKLYKPNYWVYTDKISDQK